MINEWEKDAGFWDELPPRKLNYLLEDGGGGQSTKTQVMPWAKYVPPETYAAYRRFLGKMGGQYGQGLTPKEKQYYAGQIQSGMAAQTASTGKELTDTLARSGATGGARTQAFSDLARSKVMGTSQGLSNLIGTDVQRKDINTQNIIRMIGLPSAPVSVGSTTTQSGGS